MQFLCYVTFWKRCSSYAVLVSYNHTIIIPNGWSHFRAQVNDFDTNWVVYPLSKEVSPKVRAVRAITFYNGSANADQKFTAPPKRHFFLNHWFWKCFAILFPNKVFRRRKMKSCESSETRFAKVSRRSELCSRGRSKFRKKIEIRELAFEKVTSL